MLNAVSVHLTLHSWTTFCGVMAMSFTGFGREQNQGLNINQFVGVLHHQYLVGFNCKVMLSLEERIRISMWSKRFSVLGRFKKSSLKHRKFWLICRIWTFHLLPNVRFQKSSQSKQSTPMKTESVGFKKTKKWCSFFLDRSERNR